MLVRFDPFRELDRLTEQLASTATRVPRGFPMDAYRRGTAPRRGRDAR
jgi:HSP20 family protein